MRDEDALPDTTPRLHQETFAGQTPAALVAIGAVVAIMLVNGFLFGAPGHSTVPVVSPGIGPVIVPAAGALGHPPAGSVVGPLPTPNGR